ncbi:Ig-like domain-containing protein [Cryobacterium sp. MLB-32]|uniref:Ig-like domain-containing protein n=1 Tax=Cryobacterium sp. MLB-32 TaxID=1529318 RepID=UPI000561FA5E|nr:Ig-like domain-containing protein [Cryobacterium sp. MLB-32]
MNPQLRRRLLATAAVNSHANPAIVDRALRSGSGRYRRHVASVYAITLVVSALVFLAVVLVHPAARAAVDSLSSGATSEPTTTSPAPTTSQPATGNPALVLASISIVPGAVTLPVGGTAQLTVVGNFSDGSSGPTAGVPVWVSNNDTIVSVNPDGRVTGLSPGQNATVTASLAGLIDSTVIIVTEKALTRISIRSVQSSSDTFQKDLESDGQAALPVGGDAQLVADGAYSDGTSGTLANATWASDQPGVATVDSAGRLRAVAAGTAHITASLQGNVATISLDVSDGPVVE